MSKSGNKESEKSPIKDKVAVASKHRGVFMETAEFEAETGTKLSSEIKESISVVDEKELSPDMPDSLEEKETHLDESIEPASVRKRNHPRSKKKRFTLKRVLVFNYRINYFLSYIKLCNFLYIILNF